VNGGWWRRAALLPLALLAGLWWFAAIAGIGINYAPCLGCGARPVDPWAYAYSAPIWALWFLIVPAVLVAGLALAPRRRNGRPTSPPRRRAGASAGRDPCGSRAGSPPA
jgi:hypothetical protein